LALEINTHLHSTKKLCVPDGLK